MPMERPTLHVSQGGRITVTFVDDGGQDSDVRSHGWPCWPR